MRMRLEKGWYDLSSIADNVVTFEWFEDFERCDGNYVGWNATLWTDLRMGIE